jgi:peptide chain release factor 1
MRADGPRGVDRLEGEERALLEESARPAAAARPERRRDVILEVRAGAGGERPRCSRPSSYGCTSLTPSAIGSRRGPQLNETGIDGIKEAIVQVTRDGRYSRLKFEGGVHRVQRIPATESSGRIHTSTATVVVMPEADEVEIDIDEDKDLRIEVKRYLGAGRPVRQHHRLGRSASRTPDRAGRRDPGREEQHKNKAKALSVLRFAPVDLEIQKQRERIRHAPIDGRSGDRSDKVRTYNFPQDRVTDHRIGKTVHNLPGVMDGDSTS